MAGCVAQAEGRRSWRGRRSSTSWSGRRPTTGCRSCSRGARRASGRSRPSSRPRTSSTTCRRTGGPAGAGGLPDRAGGLRQVLRLLRRALHPRRRGLAPGRPRRGGGARLVARGVEITLLGQNVNAYRDPDGVGLAALIAGWRGSRARAHPLHHLASQRHGRRADRRPRRGGEADALPAPAGAGRQRPGAEGDEPPHTAEDYLRLVERIRAARPDIALSGDFIVGFPGETEADFPETLELVEAVGYAQAFSFAYSPRPGTPAAGGRRWRGGQGRAAAAAAGAARAAAGGVPGRPGRADAAGADREAGARPARWSAARPISTPRTLKRAGGERGREWRRGGWYWRRTIRWAGWSRPEALRRLACPCAARPAMILMVHQRGASRATTFRHGSRHCHDRRQARNNAIKRSAHRGTVERTTSAAPRRVIDRSGGRPDAVGPARALAELQPRGKAARGDAQEPMAIDKDTARRVAHLARIEVAEASSSRWRRSFGGILGFMEQLREVDVDGVEPMTSVTPMQLPWREDVVTDGGIPTRCSRTPPTPAPASSPCRRWSNERADRLTIAEARDRAARRRHRRHRADRGLPRGGRGLGALNAFSALTPERARYQASLAEPRG